MTDDQTRSIDPAGEPAPTGTAAEAATTPGGITRGRWIAALGVAGGAIALTVGALLLFGGPATPEALKYIPGDAAVVAELRLDLPGDQLQKAGNLLAHFPGFLDQATLDDKVDEALSRAVSGATQNGADYRTDIKPWVNGPTFVAVMAPNDLDTGLSIAGGEHRKVVLSATTNAGVDCAKTFEGQAVTHLQHNGFDLTVSADGSVACVIDGRQALLGDPETVGLALDAKAAGTGMDRSDRYRAARSALGGDRIATLFVNGSAVRDLIPAASSLPGVPGLDALSSLGSKAPDWTIVGVRAEDDALVVDSVAAPILAGTADPSVLALPPTHASVLAPLAPGGSLLFVEDQGTGVSVQNLLARLQGIPQLAAPMAMLDGAGGAGPFLGWIEDAGIAVTMDGDEPQVAAMLVAADEATAATRLKTITGLLGIAGLTGGVTLETTTVAGVTVTSVSIPDLGAIAPPGSLPGVGQLPETGAISFSLAQRGRVIIVASSPAAMAGVLEVPAGQALADQPAFKLASQRGLANSRTSVYVAAGVAFDVVQRFLSADEAAEWATEYAPYVDPIEAFGVTITRDGAANRSRVVITVTRP